MPYVIGDTESETIGGNETNFYDGVQVSGTLQVSGRGVVTDVTQFEPISRANAEFNLIERADGVLD
jgi:hypothetical protein